MGIRESLKGKNSIVMVAAVVVIVGAGIMIVRTLGTMTAGSTGDAYFTVDDGATTFSDSVLRVAPFDYGGKQAVRAYVFPCAGKPTVGYLKRYTEHGLKVLNDARANQKAGKPPADVGELSSVGRTQVEIKKPGANEKWVLISDTTAANAVRIFKCPDGSTPEEIDPAG